MERMICCEKDQSMKKKQRFLRLHGHPSPALCCACGLCILLAGVNVTLVGAFSLAKIVPLNNPPIIIGPLLLLVALSFFGVCCMCSHQSDSQASHKPTVKDHLGLMRLDRTALEMETSEHMLQETTAIQLSPTNSFCSSHQSSPAHIHAIMLHPPEIVSSLNSNHSPCQFSTREEETTPSAPHKITEAHNFDF